MADIRPPQIDFSPLIGIGHAFGGMRREQQLGAALSALPPNATWQQKVDAIRDIDPALHLKLSVTRDPDAMTPYQEQQLEIARERNKIYADKNRGRKPPANYEWKDENDPSKGVNPIKDGPAERMSQSASGAIAMLDSADAQLNKKMPDGKTLASVLTESYSATGEGPIQYAIKENLNIGPVGMAKRAVRAKVEAALRMMTGAAAPEEEVARYTEFYTPGFGDRKETAEQKLQMLNDFAIGARDFMMRGRTGTPPRGGPGTQSAAPQAAEKWEANQWYDTPKGKLRYLGNGQWTDQ